VKQHVFPEEEKKKLGRASFQWDVVRTLFFPEGRLHFQPKRTVRHSFDEKRGGGGKL